MSEWDDDRDTSPRDFCDDDGEKGRGRGRGLGQGRGGGGGGRGGGGGFSNGGRNRDYENGDNGDENGGNYRKRGGGGGDRGAAGDVNGDEKPREQYIPAKPTEVESEIFSTGITSGINFGKFENIPVKVTGENPPQSITSFYEAGLRDLVLNNVIKSGYKVPTPIQKAAIPIIMAGRDLTGCAQTGSGKTAAFLVPIINSLLDESKDISIGRPQALVIAPTRELSRQIYEEARKFAYGSYMKASIVYGGTSTRHQSENVSKGCHILICTPGRLLDFVERAFITFEDTRFVVLDEADRMLDMGFKDSVYKVMNHPSMRQKTNRQNLMFSATFPEEIQRMAGEFLNDYIFVTIGVVGGACTDVIQTIYEVPKFEKRNKLMELLKDEADGTIVFVETKRSADFLASFLSETDFPTTSIHGDRLQSQREEALRDFRNGRMKVLIATSVAARGLDIKNIKHVINYDMPKDIDEYVHRIGRTGRVGNSGRACSFYDSNCDSGIASSLVSILEGAKQDVPAFLKTYTNGGGGYSQSQFGGRDVRRGHQTIATDVNEDEEWA